MTLARWIVAGLFAVGALYAPASYAQSTHALASATPVAPAAKPAPKVAGKPYYVEFRARSALSYGHTFAVYGRYAALAEVESDVPAEVGPLPADLPCARCGYNLRGLHPAGKCPECGGAIVPSLLAMLRAPSPDLWDEAEALLRANDDLRQFSAFVAHELRQPLSAMGLWAELLEGGPPPLNEKQRRQLDKIRSAVGRMSRLIESELSLAQMSHGELPKERIELTSLLAEVRSDLASALEQADARLETGPLGTVMADPRQLRLLFRNLVENALKHRGDAALVVHVEERDPKDAAHCIITVSHNGRGWPARRWTETIIRALEPRDDLVRQIASVCLNLPNPAGRKRR